MSHRYLTMIPMYICLFQWQMTQSESCGNVRGAPEERLQSIVNAAISRGVNFFHSNLDLCADPTVQQYLLRNKYTVHPCEQVQNTQQYHKSCSIFTGTAPPAYEVLFISILASNLVFSISLYVFIYIYLGISSWHEDKMLHRCGDPAGHSPPCFPGSRRDLPDPRSPRPEGTALPFRRALPSRDAVQLSGTATATSYTGLRSGSGHARLCHD